MTDFYFLPYFINKRNLENKAIRKGQVLFEIEDRKIYVDYSDTERIEMYGNFTLPIPNEDGSDEGKILQVQDGIWTIVEANIEGGSSTPGATFIPNVSEGGIISWTNDKGLENPQPVNIKGPQGEKGDIGAQGDIGPQGPAGSQGPQGVQGEKGEPFSIAKVYTSIEEMNIGFYTDNVPEGGFVIIETGDINNDENARLYIKGPSGYDFLTDLSGAQGIQGPQGVQGLQGPKGDQGDVGPQGLQGEQGPKGDDGTSITIINISESTANGGSNIITFSNGQTLTIKNGTQGAKGDTGATGSQGPAGSDGASATHTWENGVLTINSASGTSTINIDQMLQDKLDAIPMASSQGAIF